MIKKTIIKDTDLGGVLNPVSNNQELTQALGLDIEGPYDTIIFTKGTFEIDNNNLEKLQKRHISLLGEAYITFVKNFRKLMIEGTSTIEPKGLMTLLSENDRKYINGKN